MKKIKVVLRFSEKTVEMPLVYHLIVDYGVRVNILRASIDPGKQGRMVAEISGDVAGVSRGLGYLESLNVRVENLGEEIRHLEDRCTSCTACIPHCPTRALDVDRRSWAVTFDADKCVVCFSCLKVCIYGAMSVADRFV